MPSTAGCAAYERERGDEAALAEALAAQCLSRRAVARAQAAALARYVVRRARSIWRAAISATAMLDFGPLPRA